MILINMVPEEYLQDGRTSLNVRASKKQINYLAWALEEIVDLHTGIWGPKAS